MRSANGRRSGGRSLKKSPVEGANHCICGRKRFERKTASLPYLVASWTDSSASISFQLEDDFGHRWHHLVDFLLPFVSGNDSKPSGCGIPYASDASYPWRSSRDLGRTSQSSQSVGPGFRKRDQWTDRNRVSAGLCTRTQSGGIHLGTLETS